MNEVNLIGRVGQEIEIKKFDDDVPYCAVSIATDKSWKNKNSGEWESKTTWHRIFFSRVLAENISKAIKKGDLIRIEGELDYPVNGETGQKSFLIRGREFERLHRPTS